MSDIDSSLPVRTQSAGDVVVKVCDDTTPGQKLKVEADGSVHARAYDKDGNGLTSQVSGGQRALDVGIAVAGAQVDPRQIRALTSADVVQANLRDGAGNPFTSVNPLPVTMAESAGSPINDYKKAAAVAGGGSDDHDYTVTAGKTLYLNQALGSASGKARFELKVETGVASGVFTSVMAAFNSTAEPNIERDLKNPIAVAAGVRVRMSVANRENQAEDLYSTICGFEV